MEDENKFDPAEFLERHQHEQATVWVHPPLGVSGGVGDAAAWGTKPLRDIIAAILRGGVRGGDIDIVIHPAGGGNDVDLSGEQVRQLLRHARKLAREDHGI